MLFRFAIILFVLNISFYQVKCSEENNASIIIVGAGASGIAAATRLLENNFTNVRVLEAENRVGGRIFSKAFGGTIIDLGAEYCHGEKNNIVYSMVNEYNLLSSNKPDYVVYYSANGEEIGIDIHESLFNLAHCISHRKYYNTSDTDICLGMISEGECLKYNFDELLNLTKPEHKQILKQSYDWLKNYKSVTESSMNLTDVSLVSDYEECKGDQMLEWGGAGFKSILDIMMNVHPAQKNKQPLDVNISVQSKVRSITNSFNGSSFVQVKLEDGDLYEADHVIFTPSLGVLQAEHNRLFSPLLPKEHIFAISNIGFGLIVKIPLYFEKPWWNLQAPRIWSCIWSPEHLIELLNENLTWVKHFTAFTAPKNSRVLVAWFAGEDMVNLEQANEHNILRGIRFILSRCFVAYDGIDMPTTMFKSTWWHNPNFRGTYSYDSVKGMSTGDRKLRDKLGSPILNENGVPALLFAGEATHPTMFATVHGAIETGYREANRIINYYKNIT